jgi:hypothetical protein
MAMVDVPSLPIIETLQNPPGLWIPFLPLIPVLIFSGGGTHGDHPGPGPGPGPTVPEPSPAGLVGLGLMAMAAAQVLTAHRKREARRRKG